MPRPRAVPDRPLRAIGLVRVSKIGDRVEDDLLSPDIQRAAIRDHCARRGYDLLEPFVEGIDESGSRRRSAWWAKLDQAVGQVETGGADVIVVWRFSRTARQRLKWAVAIDRVEVAGGLLESATEPLDTSTASGRLARGMLAEMAAYEAEVIGSTWREVHARRAARGLPVNGKPRFGYRIVDGIHHPDPCTAPVVAGLYRRYLAGESIYALVGWLNQEGYRTLPGYSAKGPMPWTHVVLRRTLDSGFAAGMIRYRGSLAPGVHEPIIDAATWEAYQAARQLRRSYQQRRVQRSPYLLSGMVRCVYQMPGRACGSPMTGGTFRRGSQSMFRCIAVAAGRAHPGGYVAMSTVEQEVLAWLRREAGRVNRESDRRRGRQQVINVRRVEADAVARDILDLDRQLANLTRQLGREVIPESAYAAARDEIVEAKRVLAERHARAVLATKATDPRPVAADLLRDWPTLHVAERREILRQLITRVDVAPGRPRARVRVVPAWGENRA